MPSDAERAWESLLRLHAAVLPRLEHAVANDGRLPLSWYDVLLELNDAGGRLTMGQLGERVVLSRTRVSRVVDDLVANGLVAREVNPDDGRSAFAVLTADGRRRFLAGAKAYLPAIDQEFAPVGADGLRRLAEALESALVAVDPTVPARERRSPSRR
jgi:DNA-binding MarR family transcriptional regulator